MRLAGIDPRTLSSDDWQYLLTHRSDLSSRVFMAVTEAARIYAPEMLKEKPCRAAQILHALHESPEPNEPVPSWRHCLWPVESVIYVISDGAETLYVGRTTNLRNRMRQHWRNWVADSHPFAELSWYASDDLQADEAWTIDALNPSRNVQRPVCQ